MSRRPVVLFAVAACAGWCLACGGGASHAQCKEWDASVREVVANVEDALPADVEAKSFAENYRFVAEDLELAEGLAGCVAAGHLAEPADPVDEAPPSDVAFLDALAFGSDPKQAVAAMQAEGWTCKAGEPPADVGGKAQRCSGTYARGEAEVQLVFQAGRLARVGLAVRDIPERIEDIVAKTDADVFAARKALIDKVVEDLASRFGNLSKIQDRVESGGIHMVWEGSEGSLRARLDFTQKGPGLGFVVEDEAVLRQAADALARHPEKRAGSYFE